MYELLLPESSFLPEILLCGTFAFHGQFPDFFFYTYLTLQDMYFFMQMTTCLEQECKIRGSYWTPLFPFHACTHVVHPWDPRPFPTEIRLPQNLLQHSAPRRATEIF